jgi:hypothetical protein
VSFRARSRGEGHPRLIRITLEPRAIGRDEDPTSPRRKPGDSAFRDVPPSMQTGLAQNPGVPGLPPGACMSGGCESQAHFVANRIASPCGRSERPATGYGPPRAAAVGAGLSSATVSRRRRRDGGDGAKAAGRSERPATGYGPPRAAAMGAGLSSATVSRRRRRDGGDGAKAAGRSERPATGSGPPRAAASVTF